MRILIVEDNSELGRSIELIAKRAGYETDLASFGYDALQLIRHNSYEAIVLDLGLPDMSGWDLLSGLRCDGVDTPVVIVSGDQAVEARLRGLRFGADDYLTKPFDGRELAARLEAVIRRSAAPERHKIDLGRLVVDTDRRAVLVDGRIVPVTGNEFKVIELLAIRCGQPVSKAAFMLYLYGGRDAPTDKVINVCVCKLRQKLTAALGNDRWLGTVWAQGYILRDPDGAREALAGTLVFPTRKQKAAARKGSAKPI
jgi:two-component system cell cycle response regulator CtrA